MSVLGRFAFCDSSRVAGALCCVALSTALFGGAVAATPVPASPAAPWEALVAPEGIWLLTSAAELPEARYVLVESHDVRTIAGARVALLRWRVATAEGFVDAPLRGSRVPRRIAVSKRGLFFVDVAADDATVTRALLKKKPTIAVPKRPRKPVRTADGGTIRTSPEVCVSYDAVPACGEVCLTEVCITPDAGFTSASGKAEGRDLELVPVPSTGRIHRRPDASARYAVPAGESPFWGPRDAKVHLVVACQFGPLCLRLRDTLHALRKEYPGTLKVVWKHFVVGGASRELSLALCAAARHGRFAEMEDALWERAYGKALEPDDLRSLVAEVGVEPKALEGDEMRACSDILAADRDLIAGLGVEGTPTSFVNGRPVAGVARIETFRALIDEELRAVNAAMMSGTPLNRYHDSLLETGLKRNDWRPHPSLFERK